MTVKVISIGNPFRRDDGAAISAARKLRGLTGVEIVETDGEPTKLFAAWEGVDAAIILDASAPAGAPGRIARIVVGEAPFLKESPVASTHVYGLAKSIELAEALGARPEKVVIYTIEGEDFSHGEGLSPGVENAITSFVERITQEINAFMKEETTHA